MFKNREWESAGPDRKLFIAVRDGSIPKIREAFAAGASVNVVAPSGRTVLDTVAEVVLGQNGRMLFDYTNIVKLSEVWNELVDRGARLEKFKGCGAFMGDYTLTKRSNLLCSPKTAVFKAPANSGCISY